MKIFGAKSRKYPIKRDELGQSARQRSFDLFWQRHRPAQVCQILPISMRTACRYFEDWKKLNNRLPYSTFRKLMKKNPSITEAVINLLSDNLDMAREEVIIRMQEPWGLMRAMRGKWPNYRTKREKNEIKSRLQVALEFINLAEYLGNDREKLRHVMKKLLSLKNEAN